MRLTDYLPPRPSMSTPPAERARDVVTAHHNNEDTLLSRTGLALIICIFVSLPLALPAFGQFVDCSSGSLLSTGHRIDFGATPGNRAVGDVCYLGSISGFTFGSWSAISLWWRDHRDRDGALFEAGAETAHGEGFKRAIRFRADPPTDDEDGHFVFDLKLDSASDHWIQVRAILSAGNPDPDPDPDPDSDSDSTADSTPDLPSVTVSFVAPRSEASEDDAVLRFAVQLSTESLQEVTVEYETESGTATAGTDYEAKRGTLTFPAGTTTRTIRVPIIDDDVVEEEETFTVLLRNSNATIGERRATGVIADNDILAVVSIEADLTAVVEGGTAAFTLTRVGNQTAPLTVPVRVTERGAFLTDEVPTQATFAANASTATLQMATVDDKVDEEDGAVTVTITSGTTYRVGDAASATVAITDNDIGVVVSFAEARSEASEDDAVLRFAVQLSTESLQEVTVEYETESGTATAGTDYEAKRGTLTFPAGTIMQMIRVPIIDDDVVEEEETFRVLLRDSNATIGEGRATGVIADNDILAEVSITADPTAVVEGETVTFTLTRVGNLTVPLTVPVSIAERGAFLADGAPTEATFAVNAATATLQVATVDDKVDEEDGAVTVTITSGTTYQVGDAASATVAITDNDIDVVVSFAEARSEASEDDAALRFAVQLSKESLQEVTVEYATASGTATAGRDYQVRRGTLTFPAGTTEQTIRVPIIDDDVVEEEETFTVRLRNSNATIGEGRATGVIADNDLLAVVNIAADPTAVVEGGTAAFTLTRVGNLTAPLMVPVRVTERGAFLTDEIPTEATFVANAATATLLVATDDDGRDEADGAVTATIMDGPHQIGDAASATVLVTDNDVRGVTVIPTALTIREGESVSYMVVLTSEPTADVTVSVLVPGGAEVSVASTALTFTTKNWNTPQTVTVTAAQDDDSVPDNTVTIRHAVSGDDYGAVTAASVVVTILEDDPPTIRIADAKASEGDGEMAFSVQLSVGSIQPVTVGYATADGTAMAGTDYEETTGTLTFFALQTEQTIRIPIVDDDLDEATEAFTITLSGPENATIADGEATGVIFDNDLPVISVTTDLAGVVEGQTVTFTLTRMGDLTVPVSVTEHGAFLADGIPSEATFDIDAAVATLEVATVDDEVDEVNGAVTATIADNATHRAGDMASATVPVTDNDVHGVTVTPTVLTIPEGGSASYTVVLTSEPTADVTVAVQVPENGDIAVDETALTFTAENWKTPQTVTVTAAQDADAVADDPLTIRHAVSGGDYESVTAASVAVAILEDDMPMLLIADAEASEGDGEIVFQVRLSVASSKTVTAEYETGTGTATKGEDYEGTTGTLTFPALETAQTIRVPIIDDDLDEAAETFTVMLINASNATIGISEATGEIVDNDLPVVNVAADPTAVEEGQIVTFTLTRMGDLTVPLTVPVSVTEHGAFLADGTPTEATFATNAAIITLPVATVDDEVDEVNGAVTATIADNATHRAGDMASATVPVTDNDVHGVTVTPTVLTIPEGGSASYTVVLTSEPTADVTVAVQVPENGDIAVDETALTFTAENWKTPQTVTVTAAQDADAVADDPLTIRHAVSGGDYESVTAASVEVTILEDDTPTLLIADAAAAESDGEMAFLVRLSVASSQTVTVEYATAAGTAMAGIDYEETTGTLTFPALETEQMIRVPIIDDDLDEAVEAFTIALSNASNAAVGDSEAAGVIVDNDLPVVNVAADPAAVEEGGTVTFTLTRMGDLTVPLTVLVDVTERGAFLADGTPTEAMFDVDAEMATLLVAIDDDERDEADGAVTATITDGATHRAGDAASATVPVADNDERGVTVTPTEVMIPEGDSASYTAVLTSEPTADVTVAIQVPEDADVAVNQTALTFTADDWNTPQRVTVTAHHDADAVADEPVMLTHPVTGGDYEGVTAENVEVTITEDDTTGVTISVTALELAEGDAQSYTVVLDTEPTADVTVTIQVPDNADVAVDETALTFTAANWNTPQRVTVTAHHDDDAVADEPVMLTHTVTGGDYEGVAAENVEVTITEDDTTGVTISVTALEVTEGETGQYTIVLDTEPTADVTVAIQVPEDADVAVDETALTFTAADWNTPQRVTVTAHHDDDAVADDPVTITHPVTGGDYEGVAAENVEVTITEDDTTGVTISVTALEVTEGETGQYTIVLDTKPTADVTVAIQVPEDADIALDQTALTFTAANWNTPQRVTVTAHHDADAVADEPVTITHTVTGGDYEGVTAADVEVTITEDDTPEVSVSETALTITEGDAQSYTVVLDTEPTADVTVAIQVPDNVDVAVDQTALAFTVADWNTPQRVTVTAHHDDDAVADEPIVLTHTVTGGDYEDVTAENVEVTITEDDTAGVTISITALEVTEGETGQYTIVLDTEPAADVTVAIQVPEDADIALDQTALAFTVANWNTPQRVTVTAHHDADAVADEPVMLTHTVTGGDYEDVTAENVEVTITEDDTAGVTISITALEVTEGETGQYTIVLDTEPAADVTVAIQVPEDADIALDQTALTFTVANWNTPQRVTVTAHHDADAVADEPVMLTHTVTGGDYEGVAAADVEVTITEDDTTGVTISVTALELAEGDAQSYTVVLDTEPAADVTVAIQVPEDADIALDQTALAFTVANWNTPQRVTVTAHHDADAVADEPVTITHTVTGGDYEGVAAADVEVTITEDDTTGVTISVTALEVTEGDAQSYTVVLDTEPTADVTVAIQVPEGADVAVDQIDLAFTADDWNTPQRVTVTAHHDADAVADELVMLTHPVTGGDYEGVAAADVEVTITEDDTTGVTISITALEVTEGETGQYTIVLDTEPTADVTVAIQVPEDTDIALDQTALTFTVANWNTPQRVTVTAHHDDDAVADDPVTITHTVTGGDYEGVAAADVEVTITEDDTTGVTISVTALEVTEGETGQYTIVLDTKPTADVTVAIQVPDNADVAVDQTALAFTVANWNTPQRVTVTAHHDADAVDDEPVMLTHTVTGGDYEDVAAENVEVTITEDDTAGVTISITALEVTEGDAQSYTVVLDTEPTADVTVAIQVPGDADIALDQIDLAFTADNWNTPQRVTVTAHHDDDAVADEPVVLTHPVTGGDYEGVTAADVEVTVIEDDTAGVTISTDALEVPEGGSQSYMVVLDTEPAADVTVAIQVPDNADIAVDQTDLTFTADNWNTPQAITVTAVHDDDAVDDEIVPLTHTASGGDYEGLAVADVEVMIVEDDTPEVSVSETALTITEGDAQSYSVVLGTEPAADVAVVVAVPEDADIAVDETTLTFTADNWDTPQTVTVTAAQDDDAVDDEPVVLTHAVSGGDYEGVTASEVTVTIIEDDTPTLTIADANATEGAEEITFTVTLNVASSLAVTVDWATADDTATQGADYAETTGTLSFDALETEQTITVPLLDDALDEADETFTVALTNAANATLDDAEATGTITDNDAAPALTIADAQAAEGDREITFAVTLGAVSSFEVTVDWTTADGTATADADYTAAEGRLTFAPGQTEATIAVVVFNDALDEGTETLTVALSNPSNATIADDTATGTITDDDPSVEKAWLARFGRTTASQVMDAVSNRLMGRSRGNAHLTVGGQRVTLVALSGQGGANAVGPSVPAKNVSFADVLSRHPFYHLKKSSFADIISRSSFLLLAATDEEREVRWLAWGRGATTHFRSGEVDLSLTGSPVTALLGVDRQQGRTLAGLAVAHSLGTGEFDVHTAEERFRKGDLRSYLTSVHPYLRIAMTERLSAWGLLGYGRGQMERMADRPDADIGMQMGGLGARGTLLSPTESSAYDVALKSDAFLVRTDADAADRPDLETMMSRLRLQLEGGRPVELESGRMSPSLEVGVRHDGGDAETGLGLEVGGSLGYTHSQRGVALQATARRLLVHQASGYEEWGIGGSVNIDPGALGRGPSLRMHSSWGSAASGMDRLWSQRSAADLARSAQAAEAGLFDAELGYGLDALGGLLTPYARVASGRDTHTYGLGGRLRVEQSLRVNLVAERREHTTAQAGHELKLRSTLYW